MGLLSAAAGDVNSVLGAFDESALFGDLGAEVEAEAVEADTGSERAKSVDGARTSGPAAAAAAAVRERGAAHDVTAASASSERTEAVVLVLDA